MKAIIFTDVNGSMGFGRYAGPYRLATEMRRAGWTVDVIDCMTSFSNAEILKLIKSIGSKWVGFSSTFLMKRDFDCFSQRTVIREESDSSSSIGLEIEEAQLLVDSIVSLGCKVYIGGARLKYDLENVEWLGGISEQRFVKDFDFTTSVIDWKSSDFISEDEHLPIEIARGCIFKCSFCSYQLNGKGLWEFCKSPETVKQEMLNNYDRFGTTGYMFSDDTYNDSPEKVSNLHKAYKQLPFELEFSTYARLDLMLSKPETIPVLMDSGMKSVFFGIESLNHKSAKAVGKGMHPDKIKQGLIDIKKEYPELLISTGFIAGLPHETEETLLDTIEWLKSSPVDSFSFQVLSLGKGSAFGKDPAKYGYTVENGKWKTENLDYDTALNIANGLTNEKISSFTFYNRLRNLGYSRDEVRGLSINDKQDIVKRTNSKRSAYKEKILNEYCS